MKKVILLKENIVCNFQERIYLETMVKEFVQDAKVKINNKIYDIKISLRDLDKVENYIKELENHNNKVKQKNAIIIGIKFIVLLAGLTFFGICLANNVFEHIIYTLIFFIADIIMLCFISNDFRYFPDICTYDTAIDFKNWINKINLIKNLQFVKQNNFVIISGLEKDTGILDEFGTCVPHIKYHDKDFILIESFVTEEEFKYDFRILLPLELNKIWVKNNINNEI